MVGIKLHFVACYGQGIKKPVPFGTGFYKRDKFINLFYFVHNSFESLWVVHGQICQYLTV